MRAGTRTSALTMPTKTDWPRLIKQAIAAGIAAAVVMEAYVFATVMLPAHHSVLQSWQWIASAAIGERAFANPAYAWLGLVLHVAVSIGWAGGYAYLAQRQPFLNRRWALSGPVYGLVVYVFMDILLLGAGTFAPPATPLALLNALVAHAVFFGLPVAYTIAVLDRDVTASRA